MSLFQEVNCLVSHWQRLRANRMNAKLNEKRISELSRVSREFHLDEHIIPLEELCKRFNTDIEEGLSPAVVRIALSVNGPNIVTTSAPNKERIRFLKNMFYWFNCFLWIGSFLCFATYFIEIMTNQDMVLPDDLYLGCALAGVVIISGSFSYYQEAKSASIFLAFRDLIPRFVTVTRGGSKLRCPATDIVVGDVIDIKSGDRVPADVRLFEAQGFKCVNPLLIGDFEPFVRTNQCTHLDPLETMNLVFFSSNCIEGTARGIVIRTGDQTLMSNLLMKFQSEIKDIESESPLKKNINLFIRIISGTSISFGALMLCIAYSIGYSWLNSIIFMIALIVAQIPEGLLPTETVVLTLAAKRMTAKNCLVKNLETVESLGSTSMIITDKTGVITSNRMIVSHIWTNESIIDSENFHRHSDGKCADLDSPAWKALIRISCLSNRAEFSAAQARITPIKRKAIGDPIDIALLQYMEIIIGCVENYRQNYPKVFEIIFDPNKRYSLSINKFKGGFWLCMKGAPELILEKCSSILSFGKVYPIDDKRRNQLTDVIEELGNFGEIVIALCDKYLPYDEYRPGYKFDAEEQNFPTTDLRLIGLISFLNPPRASVPDAVMKCRNAGIKIVMMTGDHSVTAKAISRAVGIISEHNQTEEEIANRYGTEINEVSQSLVKACVMNGNQIDNMCEQDIKELVRSNKDIVLTRMTPNQKIKFINSCKERNSIIAVTGDGGQGLSDRHSPVISISMGMSGSDISKQSADIVLLDDDFASIVVGIEEGRVIFDNLKKSVCYTLSSKTPIVCPFFLHLLFGIPLALGSITILCIDLGTDMIPAISLAYEMPESDIMKSKPMDNSNFNLVNNRLLVLSYCYFGAFQVFASMFTYLVIMNENGFFGYDLIGTRKEWNSKAINDLMDSYGQEWTYKNRKTLEFTCQTAYFASVVLTKWSALVCCKTRRLSLFEQGMRNDALTFAMFFELGLAVFLSYCPGLDEGINMYPLKFRWWFSAIPFTVIMVIIDEIRRFFIRINPNGWLQRQTYY